MCLMDEYSNEEFEKIVLNSHSYSECLSNLGYKSNSGDSTNKLKEKIIEMNIDISHFNLVCDKVQRSPENIFVENSTASQRTLRKYYLEGNYTKYECSICGQKPIWNGKSLTLILDHISGNNKDDRLENLRWVCPNCNQQLDTTNGKNPFRVRFAKKYYCLDCGKEISRCSIRCRRCSGKLKANNVVSQVSREELKNLIRNYTFEEIGKMYEVSGNAVRKWCDKYNLPRRSSEIKNILDEERENI